MNKDELIKLFYNKYINDCIKCNGGQPVKIPTPDPNNGFVGVKVMFINERPGRKGTGKTGTISRRNPDPTAARFSRLQESIGLSDSDIFITNACIFYPSDSNYKDRGPNANEILCSIPILKDQIDRIKPKLLVPLGNASRKILCEVYPDSKELNKYILKKNIGEVITDTAIPIYPLYHTSNRASITRSEKLQKIDWLKMKKIIDSL